MFQTSTGICFSLNSDKSKRKNYFKITKFNLKPPPHDPQLLPMSFNPW